jgi:hypothetical protein
VLRKDRNVQSLQVLLDQAANIKIKVATKERLIFLRLMLSISKFYAENSCTAEKYGSMSFIFSA